MANIKFIAVSRSLSGILDYVTNREKTVERLISGVNCVAQTAQDEFEAVKKQFHKTDGRSYYHIVQAFAPDDPLDFDTAHEIGLKFAEYFKGYQCVVVTHMNTAHIHNHIIMNSVNFKNGQKFHQSAREMQQAKEYSNQLCREYGLSFTESKADPFRIPAWKKRLCRTIKEAMDNCATREEFIAFMAEYGYKVRWEPNQKYITYTTPEGRKCRDSKLHIEKYLKENMEAEFGYRTENDNTRNVDAAQKADGRGATAGTQRDGHGAELERAARNAGQAVSAADAVGHGPENASDESRSAGISDQDANERRKFRETGWEPEREVFFQLQGADREYEALPDRDPERYEEAAFEYGAGDAEENPDVRVDLDYSADLVRDAVRLGRAVEQMTDDAPTRDGTTMPLHIDSKRRKKLRQKKTALGHAEDDHEEMRMDTM